MTSRIAPLAALLAVAAAGCAAAPPIGLQRGEQALWRETVAELKQVARQGKENSKGIVRKMAQEWNGLVPRTPTVSLKFKWVYADKKERQEWMLRLFRDYNAVLERKGLPGVDRFLLQTGEYWEEWFPPEARERK